MGKTLVAYFSATGVTKKVAEIIGSEWGADLYEILPEIPYTEKDLDWQDPQSRSSVEMEKGILPNLLETPLDLEEYDRVLLGFPIWWYVAPTIIRGFLKDHDLKGKEVLLFATSGSSDFGKTRESLSPYLNPEEIKEGPVFKKGTTEEEIIRRVKEWKAS